MELGQKKAADASSSAIASPDTTMQPMQKRQRVHTEKFNFPKSGELQANKRGRQSSSSNTSQYVGVDKHTHQAGGKWRAFIKRDGTFYNLGTFSEEEDAACAFDAAVRTKCLASQPRKIRPRTPSIYGNIVIPVDASCLKLATNYRLQLHDGSTIPLYMSNLNEKFMQLARASQEQLTSNPDATYTEKYTFLSDCDGKPNVPTEVILHRQMLLGGASVDLLRTEFHVQVHKKITALARSTS